MRRVAESGDAEAFEVLYTRYRDRVYGFVRRLVAQDADAEDAHGRTFAAVYARAETYRYPLPVRPWLFAIAVREARRVREASGRSAVMADPEALPELARALASGADPRLLAERTELVAEIDCAIKSLPPRMREVVLLRLRAELAYGEIGEVLGIGEATARGHMRDALARIHKTVSIS